MSIFPGLASIVVAVVILLFTWGLYSGEERRLRPAFLRLFTTALGCVVVMVAQLAIIVDIGDEKVLNVISAAGLAIEVLPFLIGMVVRDSTSGPKR